MDLLNIATWTAGHARQPWSVRRLSTRYLNDYLDRVQDALTPPQRAAPAPAQAEDTFVAPAPRQRDEARLAALREQRRALEAEHASYQRSYLVAEFLLGASCCAAAVGIALFSSPFTIPLAMMMSAGGLLGAFTFYPRRHEYKEVAARLQVEVAILRGQIIEAER